MMTKARLSLLAACSLVTFAGGSFLSTPAQADVPPCSISLIVAVIEASCDDGGSAVNIVSGENSCSYTVVCS